MYQIQCTVSGLFQDINDDSGSLWSLHDCPVLYLGNNLYYTVVSWELYPSGDICPEGYIVRYIDTLNSIVEL
jgi:hypothetical protein